MAARLAGTAFLLTFGLVNLAAAYWGGDEWNLLFGTAAFIAGCLIVLFMVAV